MVLLHQPSCGMLLEMKQIKEKVSLHRHLTNFFTISELQGLKTNFILLRNVDRLISSL